MTHKAKVFKNRKERDASRRPFFFLYSNMFIHTSNPGWVKH